jgi:hypothetical protein
LLVTPPQAAHDDIVGLQRQVQAPIDRDQQHAASFNPASNRSRAELVAPFVTPDLFEASIIPMKPAMHSNLKPAIVPI